MTVFAYCSKFVDAAPGHRCLCRHAAYHPDAHKCVCGHEWTGTEIDHDRTA